MEISEAQHLARLHIGPYEVLVQTLSGGVPELRAVDPRDRVERSDKGVHTCVTRSTAPRCTAESTGILRFWLEPRGGVGNPACRAFRR